MKTKRFLCKDAFIRRSFNFNLKENQGINLIQCFSELQEQNVSCSLNLESSKIKALFVHGFKKHKFHFFFNGKGLIYGKNLKEKECEEILKEFFNQFISLCIQNDIH